MSCRYSHTCRQYGRGRRGESTWPLVFFIWAVSNEVQGGKQVAHPENFAPLFIHFFKIDFVSNFRAFSSCQVPCISSHLILYKPQKAPITFQVEIKRPWKLMEHLLAALWAPLPPLNHVAFLGETWGKIISSRIMVPSYQTPSPHRARRASPLNSVTGTDTVGGTGDTIDKEERTLRAAHRCLGVKNIASPDVPHVWDMPYIVLFGTFLTREGARPHSRVLFLKDIPELFSAVSGQS